MAKMVDYSKWKDIEVSIVVVVADLLHQTIDCLLTV